MWNCSNILSFFFFSQPSTAMRDPFLLYSGVGPAKTRTKLYGASVYLWNYPLNLNQNTTMFLFIIDRTGREGLKCLIHPMLKRESICFLLDSFKYSFCSFLFSWKFKSNLRKPSFYYYANSSIKNLHNCRKHNLTKIISDWKHFHIKHRLNFK